MWRYTPRQLAGFLYFLGKRRKREYAEALSIATKGARGDFKDVNRELKEASKE